MAWWSRRWRQRRELSNERRKQKLMSTWLSWTTNTPKQSTRNSQAQNLMNRRTKTLLPTTASLLMLKLTYGRHSSVQNSKRRQAWYLDRHARDIQPLREGDVVRKMRIVEAGCRQWETWWTFLPSWNGYEHLPAKSRSPEKIDWTTTSRNRMRNAGRWPNRQHKPIDDCCDSTRASYPKIADSNSADHYIDHTAVRYYRWSCS